MCPSKFSVHDKDILHSHNTFHPGREKHLKTFNLTLYSPSSVDSRTMLAAKSNSETDPEIKDANQHQNTLGPRRTAKSFDEVHGCACSYAQCVLKGIHTLPSPYGWTSSLFLHMAASWGFQLQRDRGELRSISWAPQNLYSPIKPQGVWKFLLTLIIFCLGSWGRWAWRAFVFKNLTFLPGKFSQALILLWFPAGDLVSRDMIKGKDISSGTYFT